MKHWYNRELRHSISDYQPKIGQDKYGKPEALGGEE